MVRRTAGMWRPPRSGPFVSTFELPAMKVESKNEARPMPNPSLKRTGCPGPLSFFR